MKIVSATSRAAGCRRHFAGAVASALLCAMIGVSQAQTTTADSDGNGLIEITSLGQLNALRHDLDGDGTPTGSAGDQAVYRTAFGLADGANNSCPGACEGYELTGDLDFDVNGDGRTWSDTIGGGYRLDSEDSQADYFPVDEEGAGGWRPIGDNDNPFAAVLEGNGYRIRNLAIRTDTTYIGLFGVIGTGAAIRNLGLVDNLAYNSAIPFANRLRVGGLVGLQQEGSITASYATGYTEVPPGRSNCAGGLVGRQQGGSIRASYATGNVRSRASSSTSCTGGLVGQQADGSITESHATGHVFSRSGSSGGLVGLQGGGSITASYATGAVDFSVTVAQASSNGGLVGRQSGGSITASYATGAATEVRNNGSSDVGGLVGWQRGGSITASYATGAVDGGGGGYDNAGGLVGWQGGGSITASYATGDAASGNEIGDRCGRLIGQRTGGSSRQSYGFGRAIAGNSIGLDGAPPVSSAAGLTGANAGSDWHDAGRGTLDAWDFGTNEQFPALNYADYDGAAAAFDCDRFVVSSCGALLPEQQQLSAGGPSSVMIGTELRLTGSDRFGRVPVRSWRWRQLQGTPVDLRGTDTAVVTFTAPDAGTLLVFEVTAEYSDRRLSDRISVGIVAHAVDGDGDGLIEIDSLTMLHNMRYDLTGASYRSGAEGVPNSLGCPGARCRGYELTAELDFDADGDGSSWSGSRDGGYRLDAGDSQADYFPVDEEGAGGWRPIGGGDAFVAVFDGNGHRIRNLAVRRDQKYVGLFGRIALGAAIRNLGLVDNLADHTGSSEGVKYIGGLVGEQVAGSIIASYATGIVVGGRAGGNNHNVGSLVGQQSGGSITASYARGAADGGNGTFDAVGGLVGRQSGGVITASYATGAADGGGGDDRVGGLVGRQSGGSIRASYATGDADGGGGNGDYDYAGELVGLREGGSSSQSYGFGGVMGQESTGADGSPPVSAAAQLTSMDAGDLWNTDTLATSLGAWNFGTNRQLPALYYADYDGAGAVFDCDQFPAGACGTLLPGQLGLSLSAAGFQATGLEFGAMATLTASIAIERVPILSWSWRQLEGTAVTLMDATARMATFIAPAPGTPLVFELTATDSEGGRHSERISLRVAVDGDGDGLIEIRNLTMLHNMRHDLEGAGYRTGADAGANSLGCPGGRCRGYELTADLDFDADEDGASWSGDREGGYRLDPEDHHPDYFPVDEDGAGGWLPVGDPANPFVAVFDGGGYRLSNLGIRRDQTYVGLFGAIGGGASLEEAAAIRNLGLVDNLADYTGSSDGRVFIGGLVGRQETGTISLSYATGAADGGDGDDDYVGGLVGWQQDGLIIESYATGAADGGAGLENTIGGLVGQQGGGSIRASYATGDATGEDGNKDHVGGLVGFQGGGDGEITASYATGVVNCSFDGRGGGLVGTVNSGGGSITASYARGAVNCAAAKGGGGGLVGLMVRGMITASYATGAVNGDSAGGLVGEQRGGSITASYATGAVNGDDVGGGLVGFLSDGMITASYATGAVNGGRGPAFAGGLVGAQNVGLIRASYGFGRVMGDESRGSAGSVKPVGAGGSGAITSPVQLTAANAGLDEDGNQWWNHADYNTSGAWDFGTDEQAPALEYADYDGLGAVFNCNQFPDGDNLCNTLLPGQVGLSASGPPNVLAGAELTLTGSIRYGRVEIRSWRWQQLEGTRVALRGADSPTASFRAPAAGAPLVFELTATDREGNQYTERISIAVVAEPGDGDGDGLIEIRSLAMLHDMRHDLRGTGYRAADAVANSLGCPEEGGCFGYELTANLDFDADGDGTAWSGDSEGGYRLDPEDRHPDYFPVNEDGAGGWRPIGDNNSPFAAVFEGNSHTISNLAIRMDTVYIGLFGAVGEGAAIRNLGLVDNLADYTGSSDGVVFIGGLVGRQGSGTITASYATGAAAGGDGKQDRVGGLVGYLNRGSITASYATGPAAGGDGDDDVGGLVGHQKGGSITASYATGPADGGDGNSDSVGGLVGWQLGSITASYATGDADGGDGGEDLVGGLVGFHRGSIRASYATGDADGGDGGEDLVGGLVGFHRGSIRASYATGDADGGDGDEDLVGGLVGWQLGSITASYATGDADGGDGDFDSVGGLVGAGTKTLTASYGFGEAIGSEPSLSSSEPSSDGSAKPAAVSSAAQLSAANAGSAWNAADIHTLGAWDFGTDEQVPALNYADYDGSGIVFDCDRFPAGACGTLLPGQDSLSAGQPPAAGLEFGATATLTGSVRFGRVQIRSWRWRQLEGAEVSLRDAEGPLATFRAPVPGVPLVFDLSATDSEGRQYSDRISLQVAVDGDGDGLIEIRNLSMLHNMRHDLTGASYKTSAGAGGNNLGCPAGGGCFGYELVQHLDFDTDGDGTWSGDSEGGYRLDPDDHHPDYFPVDENGAGGWRPIGDHILNPFVAVFEGNSHTISNLAIRRSNSVYIGLFGAIGGGTRQVQVAVIRNLGLVDNLADYTGSRDGNSYGRIGGLVGEQTNGSITASYATGPVDGGDGANDGVGGLVGRLVRGSIRASYATGPVDGGDGANDGVGGLVGRLVRGSIRASYATGPVDGGDGENDNVGGLVGYQSLASITASYAWGDAGGGDGENDNVGGLVGYQLLGSMITASYATGGAGGGDGNMDYVGGLVGYQLLGSMITASYATGTADGGDGDEDLVGGLVGRQLGSITASYATGDADGGRGSLDSVGGLVGAESRSITASYSFGEAIGHETPVGPDEPSEGSEKPAAVSSAAQLTAANAGSAWNAADSHTLGAWDFGTDEQVPALNYADYDGTGAVFDCDQFPAGACGTLLPGQADLSAGEPPASGLEFGATATLTGSVRFGRVQILSWRWRQLEGTTVSLRDAEGPMATFRAPAPGAPLVFELSATDSEGVQYSDRISLEVAVDGDGDGLIEIRNLSMLHNMRHDLEGASYKTSAGAEGNNLGCPGALCRGYELVQHLDFDGDGDGTWSGDGEGGYRLDPDDHHPDYFPVNEDDAGGWRPIGDLDQPFVAVFEGNSHTISHLAIRRNQPYVGLFGAIGEGAAIRNLGLVDNLADYTGTGDGLIFIGGLVGRQESGTISASYATGAADGGDGDFDVVGGLVGWQERGTISLSYATGAADGGGGELGSVGGLVGRQERGTISASYATGAADGGGGANDQVGGLVGRQSAGTISESYAEGAAAGGGGDGNAVGGLVGWQETGTISLSYARGAADGGGGANDQVGGLVGRQSAGTISESYAEGAAAGGGGDGNAVGGLVGWQETGTILLSYARGAADGGGGASDQVGGLVGAQSGTIILSFATGAAAGGDGDGDAVGGLVGRQSAGSIRASYATGAAAGGDNVGGSESSQEGRSISAGYIAGPATGGDNIGGLVGWQEGGSIRASYATGEAVGGAGNDVVGALVGVQYGTIRSSYARGHARGGAGDDVVGALVGELVGGRGTGSIVASYAAGNASGGEGGNDAVGALVGALAGGGQITASVIASYGFGQVDGEELFGSEGTPLPEGVEEAADLTRDNAGQGWSDIDWDFGTGTQPPALAHNGTLLPGQGRGGAGGGVGGGGGGGFLNPLALALLALPFLPGWRRRLLPRRAAPLKPGAGATRPSGAGATPGGPAASLKPGAGGDPALTIGGSSGKLSCRGNRVAYAACSAPSAVL